MVIVIGGDVVGVKRGHSLVKRRSAVAMYIHAASSHEIVTVRVKGSFSFFFYLKFGYSGRRLRTFRTAQI